MASKILYEIVVVIEIILDGLKGTSTMSKVEVEVGDFVKKFALIGTTFFGIFK